MRWNTMFITAVCVIFLILQDLQCISTTKVYDNIFLKVKHCRSSFAVFNLLISRKSVKTREKFGQKQAIVNHRPGASFEASPHVVSAHVPSMMVKKHGGG